MLNQIKSFVIFALIVTWSCTADQKDENVNSALNTIIKIHFKKESDKGTFTFQRYDPYFLEQYGIVAPPQHTLKDEHLQSTIRLQLNKPALLLFGFTEFYVSPGDSLDIDYTVLKQNKNVVFDSIRINNGTGIITLRHTRLFLDKNFSKKLQSETDINMITGFLNRDALQKPIDYSLKELFDAYPAYKDSATIKDYFEQYFEQFYFSTVMYYLDKDFENIPEKLRKHVTDKIQQFAIDLDKNSELKLRNFWYGMRKVYELTLNQEFENRLFEYRRIRPLIASYSSLTQQFFLLLAVKNNWIPDVNMNRQIDVNASLSSLGSYITSPDFITFFEKFNKGAGKGNQLDSTARYAALFDSDMKKTTLDEVFQQTSQKFILIDFSGSWCAPCMEEIHKYIRYRKLDTSAIVKPIWLFFENNSYDWFIVLKKYNLKKKNCFLVADKEALSKSFAQQFLWRGEFPHYFLFDRNRVLINADAPALSEFEPHTLIKNKNKSTAPMPPPLK